MALVLRANHKYKRNPQLDASIEKKPAMHKPVDKEVTMNALAALDRQRLHLANCLKETLEAESCGKFLRSKLPSTPRLFFIAVRKLVM